MGIVVQPHEIGLGDVWGERGGRATVDDIQARHPAVPELVYAAESAACVEAVQAAAPARGWWDEECKSWNPDTRAGEDGARECERGAFVGRWGGGGE